MWVETTQSDQRLRSAEKKGKSVTTQYFGNFSIFSTSALFVKGILIALNCRADKNLWQITEINRRCYQWKFTEYEKRAWQMYTLCLQIHWNQSQADPDISQSWIWLKAENTNLDFEHHVDPLLRGPSWGACYWWGGLPTCALAPPQVDIGIYWYMCWCRWIRMNMRSYFISVITSIIEFFCYGAHNIGP